MAEGEAEEELDGLDGLDTDPPKEAVVGPSGKVYSDVALGLFRVGDEPRRRAILLVEEPRFDAFILVTILANCTTMAWVSPLDPCCTPKAHFVDICEGMFLLIFTVEMLSKIVAYGFVMHETSYLRDAWCQLDFVVVSLAWLPILIPSFGNYSVIRSVRALRPLRALKRMPGMPVLINSLLAAIPKLGNVANLCGLLILILGVIGTEEFKGDLHYRCATPGYVEPANHPSLLPHFHSGEHHTTPGRQLLPTSLSLAAHAAVEDTQPPLSTRTAVHRMLKGGGSGGAGNFSFDTGLYCDPLAEVDHVCRGGTACQYFEPNENHGVTTFDTFGWTSVIILQVNGTRARSVLLRALVPCSPLKRACAPTSPRRPRPRRDHHRHRHSQALTFDSWTLPMYALIHTTSTHLVVVFWLFIVLVGGFFIVNLFLAVLFE
jgi:hypothetical protein